MQSKLISIRTFGLAVFLALPGVCGAQERNPHIGYVYPGGGQRKQTIVVTVGGQYLQGPKEVLFSGVGITATVIKHKKPPSRGQLNRLRQKLQEWLKKNDDDKAKGSKGTKKGKNTKNPKQAKRPRRRSIESVPPGIFTSIAKSLGLRDFDIPAFVKYRKRLRDPKRQLNPQIEETVTVELKIAADAPLGRREFRLRSNLGVSNPIFFQVEQWAEYREVEPNNTTADTGFNAKLPVVLNGQIMPGDVDRFAFSARRGTRLVAAVQARALVPYLADAVPGWFQAVLTLYDDTGKRVAYVDDFRFNPDPVLCFKVPASGRYILEIKDSIYRGREDFVYRISLGSIPFVTSIFPLGGRVGEDTEVKLRGWNLKKSTMTMNGRDRERGTCSLSQQRSRVNTNFLPFAFDTLPERREEEPNNGGDNCQEINLPLVMNGRINRVGDTDVFRFKGFAGEQIVAEVLARRLASPLDSLLKLTDEQGKLLAANDDFVDKGAGLTTHHADSRLLFKLPAAGNYLLHLGDTQGKGGDAYSYRLRLSRQKPDFGLRVVPASINAKPGQNVVLTAYALRHDGFNGEIKLALHDAPADFFISGGMIPAGQEKVRFTLAVPRRGSAKPFELRLDGIANVGKREVRHRATPAEDLMQAFLYRHLVPAENMLIVVNGRSRAGQALRVVGDGPMKIPAGWRAWVYLYGGRNSNLSKVELELNQAPKGIFIEKLVPVAKGGVSILFDTDAKLVKAGQQGNLIISAYLVRTVQGRGKKKATKRRIPIGVLPAISYKIMRASL